MTLKTIKISEENYRWLAQLSGELQKLLGKPVSLDKTLYLLHHGNLKDLAGSWKISDKEAETFLKTLSKEWKQWKISA